MTRLALSWHGARCFRYPPELLERGVRMVEESGRPIARVAKDLGISGEVLRKRVRQAEADRGERPAVLSTGEREELKLLRREVAQLRRANAILKDAPRYPQLRKALPDRADQGSDRGQEDR